MIDKIKTLIKNSNLSTSSFLKEVGLPLSAITEWSKGKAKPSLSSIVKIADYFDVSVDYLLGRTNNPRINKADSENALKYTNVTFEDDKARIAAFGGGIKNDDGEDIFTT